MLRTYLNLQDRDIALLRTLAENFRILTSEQIGELFPMGSRRRVNFRLKRLRDAGYLSYRELLRVGSIRQGAFHLGPQAFTVFAESEKNSVQSARMQAAGLAESGLAHRMLVDWVHIRFLTASRRYPEFRLCTWVDQYSRWWEELRRYGVPVQADGYVECLQLFGFEHLVTFFLEVDRSTEGGHAIEDKIERYIAYAGSGKYEQQFAARPFRVLFVTKSTERRDRLIELMERKGCDVFLVTTWADFKKSKLLEAHWRRPRVPGTFSLFSKL